MLLQLPLEVLLVVAEQSPAVWVVLCRVVRLLGLYSLDKKVQQKMKAKFSREVHEEVYGLSMFESKHYMCLPNKMYHGFYERSTFTSDNKLQLSYEKGNCVNGVLEGKFKAEYGPYEYIYNYLHGYLHGKQKLYRNKVLDGTWYCEYGITKSYKRSCSTDGFKKLLKYSVENESCVETTYWTYNFENSIATTTSSKFHYVNGLLEGEQCWYHRNGKPSEVANYTKGERNGRFVTWFGDGSVSFETVYKDGLINGVCCTYYHPEFGLGVPANYTGVQDTEKGNCYHVSVIGNYKNGMLHGDYRSYFNNGNLACKAHYINGILNGKYVQYYSNGDLMIDGFKKDGEFDGRYREYYSGNKIRYEVYVKKRKREGSFLEYYPSGNIKLVATFEADVLHGKYRLFSDASEEKDRVALIECEYLFNQYHGDYIVRAETGTELERKKFVFGMELTEPNTPGEHPSGNNENKRKHHQNYSHSRNVRKCSRSPENIDLS